MKLEILKDLLIQFIEKKNSLGKMSIQQEMLLGEKMSWKNVLVE